MARRRSNVEPCSHPREKCNCGCGRPKSECDSWCNVEPPCEPELDCECDYDPDYDYECDYECDCDYESDYDCDYDCDCNCECDYDHNTTNCDECYRLEELAKERRLQGERILSNAKKLEAEACLLLKEADEIACRAEECFKNCENQCRAECPPYCRPCRPFGYRGGSIKCETRCIPKKGRESN